MNRRSLMGMIAGAPFAGKAVADQFVSGGAIPPDPDKSGMGSTLGMNAAQQEPRMNRSSAMRLIFGDKQALAEIREELFAEYRFVPSIDPDILEMKSWSIMAKVTFQRQRNVARAMAELQNDDSMPSRYVCALEGKLKNLMWGK